MNKILAIDPGTTESGFVVWDGEQILDCGKIDNEAMLEYVATKNYDTLLIEKIVSYGKSVGQTTFDTVFWCGRFYQTGFDADKRIELIVRKAVKLHHCDNDNKAKDAKVIQALKDRFEPGLEARKKPRGMLKDLKKDAWQALAIAVYFHDINQ